MGNAVIDDLLERFRLQRRRQHRVGTSNRGRHLDQHLGQLRRQYFERLLQRVLVAETDFDAIAIAVDAAVANILVAQFTAGTGLQTLQALVDDRLGIDLHQEVHAAAQIESQIHRERVDRLQPVRRIRHQVEGDHVDRIGRVGIQFLFQQSLGLELGIGIVETGAHRALGAGGLESDAVRRQITLLQHLRNLVSQGAVDLQGRFAAAHLYRRRFAKEIRYGVQHAKQQRDDDQNIFPERIAIHSDSAFCASLKIR